MIILGLTGSIGMGKSVVANQFFRQKIPVFDADSAVHQLLREGGEAVLPVSQAFPTAYKEGAIDRQILGKLVFNQPQALARLENIIHPLVHEKESRFLHNVARRNYRLAVLEIPLLYETGADTRCDAVAVVTAPKLLQKSRVMQRPGMSEEKLERILQLQMPDTEKTRRADFVIYTALGRRHSLKAVKQIIQALHTRPDAAWQNYPYK